MVEKEDFEKLFEEVVEGGLCEQKNRRYTCAIELFYKAFIKLVDYLLISEHDIVVKNNRDRDNNMLKLNSDLKSLKDKLYIVYVGTYKSKKDKMDCKEVRNGIKQIISLKRFEGNIKKTAEKI